jgi:hypothetical protein
VEEDEEAWYSGVNYKYEHPTSNDEWSAKPREMGFLPFCKTESPSHSSFIKMPRSAIGCWTLDVRRSTLKNSGNAASVALSLTQGKTIHHFPFILPTIPEIS